MRNRKICIVGYGEHVKNTIIPSLNLKKKNIKIITRKKNCSFFSFPDIKSATKQLTKDYIFFNSTPPKDHFITSKLILNSGFNLIVEKPLCTHLKQLRHLHQIARKNRVIIFESMMFFYSKQFTLLKKILKRKDIKEININFSIPRVRKNTFRTEKNLESSILYDMGCYPFSLISYFRFNSNNYKVFYKTKNKRLSFIKTTFLSKKIKFQVIIAIYKTYQNYVQIIFKNNSQYYLDYFFYGKTIQKNNYFLSSSKRKNLIKINEKNLFKSIFSFSDKKLIELSNSQYLIVKRYLNSLDQIKKKIKL